MCKARSLSVIAPFLVSVGGCGGDDPMGTGDALSEAELVAVFAILGQAYASLRPTPGAVGPAAVTFDQNLAGAVECTEGGSVSGTATLNGTIDDQTGATDLAYVATITPNGCTLSTQNGTVTVNGNPSLQVTVDATLDSSGSTNTGTWTGGFGFTTSNNRSGSCSMDVTFTTSFTAGSSATSSVSGTACGIAADSFTTLNVGDL